MRAALFTWLLLTSVLQLCAQQTSTTYSSVSSILARMNSASRTEREKAFREAGEMRGAEAWVPKQTDAKAKAGAPYKGASEVEEGEGEEESDYYSVLVGFVANLNDERAIPALLGAANRGGIATRGVARFGKRALDPTLTQAKNANADLAEGALWVIRDMLEFGLVSDPESHLRIKEALRSSLGSSEFGIRVSAMGAIEYLGDRDEFVDRKSTRLNSSH